MAMPFRYFVATANFGVNATIHTLESFVRILVKDLMDSILGTTLLGRIGFATTAGPEAKSWFAPKKRLNQSARGTGKNQAEIFFILKHHK
jgi:hypothetical protein